MIFSSSRLPSTAWLLIANARQVCNSNLFNYIDLPTEGMLNFLIFLGCTRAHKGCIDRCSVFEYRVNCLVIGWRLQFFSFPSRDFIRPFSALSLSFYAGIALQTINLSLEAVTHFRKGKLTNILHRFASRSFIWVGHAIGRNVDWYFRLWSLPMNLKVMVG